VSHPPRFTVGLIGSSVATSLSPALHEREADELGLRYLYQLIDLDELGLPPEAVIELVPEAERMGFAGLNITHPCKQAVLHVLDELYPEAALIGAVNTVLLHDGRRVGHNTDHIGFAENFRRGLPGASLREVVLLGAGGSGAAVAYALLRLGAERIRVVDVRPERARSLATALGVSYPGRLVPAGADELPQLLAGADGLVNASAVGMTPHLGTPVPAHLLIPHLWVADVVYRPLVTQLLSDARAAGCRVLGGGAMVVFQAAAAFELFTGVTPDSERMYRHFE